MKEIKLPMAETQLYDWQATPISLIVGDAHRIEQDPESWEQAYNDWMLFLAGCIPCGILEIMCKRVSKMLSETGNDIPWRDLNNALAREMHRIGNNEPIESEPEPEPGREEIETAIHGALDEFKCRHIK